MDFDPYELSIHEDPYPLFRDLRENHPILYSESKDFWVVSRYEDVRSVLQDGETFASGQGTVPDGFLPSKPMMIVEDAPYHTHLRAAVSWRFRPRRLRSFEAVIEKVSGELLDAIDPTAETDLVQAYCDPLPVAIVTELLGIGFEDREAFKVHASRIIHPGGREGEEVMQAQNWIYEYIERMLPSREAQPGDDLISSLIHPPAGVPKLNQDELLGFCSMLLIAGPETTTNAFSNALWVLDREPELRSALARDASGIELAVEEFLRFESPAPGLSRVTTRDVELCGRTLPKGSRVHMLFASANRDESVFPGADRVDARRYPNPHLAFGLGVHFCLGSRLARLELRIGLAQFLKRFPSFALIPERWERLPSEVARGFVKLPFRPTGGASTA
ncbi:MAG: cytochrome P450 [Deltaproteobacteria bacterium]|nr:cytochrome P450 [Deltaproteobacteria bacterium]MBW2362640.1 cytochrome P450 [Deltaproteobacteria bacterium]